MGAIKFSFKAMDVEVWFAFRTFDGAACVGIDAKTSSRIMVEIYLKCIVNSLVKFVASEEDFKTLEDKRMVRVLVELDLSKDLITELEIE